MKNKKQVVVISLGGSLIAPKEIDVEFLKNFRKTIKKHLSEKRFIIVCGGGATARKYIKALSGSEIKSKKNLRMQSLIGIASTRLNARFVSYFFGYEQKKGIPFTKRTLKKYLKKKGIVFCGALEYKPDQTSDSTAAELAKKYKTFFINITNVKGLYDKDPNKHKNAKLIKKISWKEFNKKTNKMDFKPGQNFVLDQTASEVILNNKIPTYIIGKDMKELDNLLQEKKDFEGTLVKD